jgi:uncharacterized protein YndB with AHSA1/START domain
MNFKPTDEPAERRTLVITREYDVPASTIFLAMSRPEHVKRWFGPVGYPLTLCEMDFRVGGHFRFQMTGPDGVKGTPFGGAYWEIIPDRKIVYDNGFEPPTEERMLVTLTLETRGARTVLTHHTEFASVAMYESHTGVGFEAGTNSGLDQLGEVAEELAGKA